MFPNQRNPLQPDLDDPNLHQNSEWINSLGTMHIGSPMTPPGDRTPWIRQDNFGLHSSPSGFGQTPGGMFDSQRMINTPPAGSSFEDLEAVQETQPETSVSSPQKEKRKHRKRVTEEPKKIPTQINWSEAESLALCRAWVDVSEDPKCANYQKARTFWLKIQEYYHLALNRPTYRGIESLQGKWRKIRTSVTKFNAIITRLQGSGYQSGSNLQDLISDACSEYNATNPNFNFLKEWQCLRKSSKWEVIETMDTMSSQGTEPSSKRSKTTSESSGQQSVGSSGRVGFDLNDTDVEEPQPELSRLSRPVGRDAAKKAGRAGGSRKGKAAAVDGEAYNLAVEMRNLQEQDKQRQEIELKKLALKSKKQRSRDMDLL